MGTRLSGALLVAGMLMTTGCGDNSASGQLWGRTFLSSAVTEGGAPRPLVSGTRVRMTFEDGAVKLNAGCNHLNAQVGLDEGKLTVSDLSSTAIGCDQASQQQDEWLSKFLAAGPGWRLDGSDLVLSTKDAELRLTDSKVADPDRELRKTRWHVESIIDGQAVGSTPAGAEAYLVFGDGDRVEGSTGCNTFGGSAVHSGQQITFSGFTMTDAACPDERQVLEAAVVAILDGSVTFEIEADRLVLTHSSGRGLQLRAS